MCPRMQLVNTYSNYAFDAQEISQDSVITLLWQSFWNSKRNFLFFLMAHQVNFWINKLQLTTTPPPHTHATKNLRMGFTRNTSIINQGTALGYPSKSAFCQHSHLSVLWSKAEPSVLLDCKINRKLMQLPKSVSNLPLNLQFIPLAYN